MKATSLESPEVGGKERVQEKRPLFTVAESSDDEFGKTQPKSPEAAGQSETNTLTTDFSNMIMISQSWLQQLEARSCRFLIPLSKELEDFTTRCVMTLSIQEKCASCDFEENTIELWNEYAKLKEVMISLGVHEKPLVENAD